MSAAQGGRQASLRAFGPDLELRAARIDPDLLNIAVLRTQVANLGTEASPATTLRLRHDAATGPLVAELPVPMVQPGKTITLTLPFDRGSSELSLNTWLAAINEQDFDEVDRTNNAAALQLTSGPDPMLSAFNLAVGDLRASSIPISATVFNVGPVAAANLELQIYDNPARTPTNLVARAAVGPLASGEATTVGVLVPGPLACGLYVQIVSPGGDVSPANNFVTVGQSSTCSDQAYLPLVQKQ